MAQDALPPAIQGKWPRFVALDNQCPPVDSSSQASVRLGTGRLHQLLRASFGVFAREALTNNELKAFVDSYLRHRRRPYDLMGPIASQCLQQRDSDPFEQELQALDRAVFLFHARIVSGGHNEVAEQSDSSVRAILQEAGVLADGGGSFGSANDGALTDEEWGAALYDSWGLDAAKLADLCCLFSGSPRRPLGAAVSQAATQLQPALLPDLAQTLPQLNLVLRESADRLSSPLEPLGIGRRASSVAAAAGGGARSAGRSLGRVLVLGSVRDAERAARGEVRESVLQKVRDQCRYICDVCHTAHRLLIGVPSLCTAALNCHASGPAPADPLAPGGLLASLLLAADHVLPAMAVVLVPGQLRSQAKTHAEAARWLSGRQSGGGDVRLTAEERTFVAIHAARLACAHAVAACLFHGFFEPTRAAAPATTLASLLRARSRGARLDGEQALLSLLHGEAGAGLPEAATPENAEFSALEASARLVRAAGRFCEVAAEVQEAGQLVSDVRGARFIGASKSTAAAQALSFAAVPALLAAVADSLRGSGSRGSAIADDAQALAVRVGAIANKEPVPIMPVEVAAAPAAAAAAAAGADSPSAGFGPGGLRQTSVASLDDELEPMDPSLKHATLAIARMQSWDEYEDEEDDTMELGGEGGIVVDGAAEAEEDDEERKGEASGQGKRTAGQAGGGRGGGGRGGGGRSDGRPTRPDTTGRGRRRKKHGQKGRALRKGAAGGGGAR